ncbi:MAG: glycosyltransferase family 2 protein [Fibrobacterota bacterium]|nr:glycosyltransferase family 2 protein [Fibrobacterota bacterium]QQS03690.1 MAG: glycosyltransferase family 2 protein [Fibrobacterota bacterium]
MPDQNGPSVSIVIPVYGRGDLLLRCLESIFQTCGVGDAEIVVVDDASPDPATRAILDELARDQRLRVVRQTVNGGFATACNRGFELATGELVVLLNSDTEVQAGWMQPLVESFSEGDVAVAGGLLVYPGTSQVIQHAGIGFHGTGEGIRAFHYGQFWRLAQAPWARERRYLPAVTGACLAVRRKAIEDPTLLDVRFRNGYEDVDLCLRLGEAGWKIRYCGDSLVVHLESVSSIRFASERENARLFRSRWKGLGGRYGSDSSAWEAKDRKARRAYLLDPSPWNAAAVAKLAGRTGNEDEIRQWRELSRGSLLPWKRISAERRKRLHGILGFDDLEIRSC